MKKLLTLLSIVAAAAAAWWYWAGEEVPGTARYRTQAVDRGDIVQAVTANGTLSPLTVVQVGTQVSGTVYKVHVDFNDLVKEGQVLAELDPALLQATLKQTEASLENARATLELTLSNVARTETLFKRNLAPDSDLDQARERAKVAAAQVKTAEAQVERDRTNLRYAVIRSPIAGVVINRQVNVGQTVAASFQTPTLFQIAQDLRKMQIDTSVAEADVGSLSTSFPVTFTVDAFPGQTFQGRILQIRLNPTIQANVVTYNVVVEADNPEGRLLPGMTAHVSIRVAERRDVLRVPNAALSFRPKDRDDEEPAARPVRGTRIYRLDGDSPRAIAVRTGITDGNHTEIVEGDIAAGDQVVVRETVPKKDAAEKTFRFRMM
jgi:HlyD family secretion protein